MRKFILITAMVLVSATAQAGGSSGSILASNDEATTAVPAQAADTKPVDVKPAEAQPAETPKYIDRPAAVDTKTRQSADQCPCVVPASADATRDTVKIAKPKRRHESTEARVIYELHRHGITGDRAGCDGMTVVTSKVQSIRQCFPIDNTPRSAGPPGSRTCPLSVPRRSVRLV